MKRLYKELNYFLANSCLKEKPVTEKSENVVSYWGVNEIEKEYKHLLELGELSMRSLQMWEVNLWWHLLNPNYSIE